MPSTACQTPIKVETEEAVRPQVNIPATPDTVTITAQEHLVYKGAVNNIRRLINAQAKTKQELKEAKAGGSQEVIQALADMTAERDALRQQQILEGETHAKELARAAIAGKLFSDYHAASYGQVVAEMVTLEDMGIKAEDYPPASSSTNI